MRGSDRRLFFCEAGGGGDSGRIYCFSESRACLVGTVFGTRRVVQSLLLVACCFLATDLPYVVSFVRRARYGRKEMLFPPLNPSCSICGVVEVCGVFIVLSCSALLRSATFARCRLFVDSDCSAEGISPAFPFFSLLFGSEET